MRLFEESVVGPGSKGESQVVLQSSFLHSGHREKTVLLEHTFASNGALHCRTLQPLTSTCVGLGAWEHIRTKKVNYLAEAKIAVILITVECEAWPRQSRVPHSFAFFANEWATADLTKTSTARRLMFSAGAPGLSRVQDLGCCHAAILVVHRNSCP